MVAAARPGILLLDLYMPEMYGHAGAHARTRPYLRCTEANTGAHAFPACACLALADELFRGQKTEPNLDVETSSQSPPAAFAQVTVAEDERFELLRGCPQHAFQHCWPVFTAGRDRS